MTRWFEDIVIGEPFWPSGDEAADLQRMLAFYRPFVPRKPEHAFLGG